MIRFPAIKKKRKQEKNDATKKCCSSALIRLTKDVNALQSSEICSIAFPDPDDLFNFQLKITPDEGFYKHAAHDFIFRVSPEYPYDPPKVRCMTDIYHPNIDTEGNVCLNILREDWNPILDLNAIVFGLLHLLLDPNPDDPLNEKAAEEFRSDQISFANNVSRVMDKVITAAALSED